jgi:SAM-dependent methyltransferase
MRSEENRVSAHNDAMRETWETSFAEQISRHAYNTAPVEALVRSISYYLRDRMDGRDLSALHFAEMGCGAGPNLVWLAERGVGVSGVDIAPTALDLARGALEERGLGGRVRSLIEGSVSDVAELPDESLDGVIESCVYQHLSLADRSAAFREVDRLVKPGGLFVGHMLERGHTVFRAHADETLEDDPGTLVLEEGGSSIYLTNIGLSHFFTKDEVRELLPGWSVVDPCLSQYELPGSEAQKRGYGRYLQSMLIVYAIK